MENIILTNNKDLRLVSVKVGVLSTLRFELPLVSASATHVEVIVTSGDVPSAYTATFIDATKRWQCDIAASQFPTVGKQSYEVAYVLDGKQFWDGKGWIEIEDATTSGIEPQPRPEPYRYAVVSVNGYGADAQGAVRIPKTFIATDSPTTTEGFMEGDIYFNRETGATWTLCNVQSTLTWVFNYKNYYTKAETDNAIERVAAYYITYNAAGAAFPTRADLINAQTYYSGGVVRVPTRNDYAVVLADETHDGAEWRYIYAVADGQTTGQWEAQYPVEGVIAYDNTVTPNSGNGVKSSGIWSALWGALSALPTGFSSLYDWVVSQLAGKEDIFTPAMTSIHGLRSVFAQVKDGTTIYETTIPTTVMLADKQDALSAQQLANIAAVSDALAFDATHSYAAGDPVVYNGTLYTFTSAHTGAWTGSDVSAVDIIAMLAGKLDKSGGTMTGEFRVGTMLDGNFQVVPETNDGEYTPPTMRFGDGAGVVGIIWRLVDDGVAADVSDAFGNTYRIAFPSASGTLALTADIPYSLVTKTITNNAVTLDDRAANAVTISATLSPNTLTVNFPTATSGKARDFAMRLNITAGVTAPEIAWPQGVTLENNGGEVPEIADGGTGGSSTILYFSETENNGTTAKFLVKGETLTAIAQA